MKNTQQADDSFFIGWADASPSDRRFFVRTGLGLIAAAGALGFGLSALQQAPGSGRWDSDTVRDWRGVVTSEPYPMLRTLDLGVGPRTALLSCLGKCGVAARLDALEGQAVVIRGSLIQRDLHAMIAVDESEDWIRLDSKGAASASLAPTAPQALGTFVGTGEILDSKCWFGAMRPSSGKVHKACASLCIRGGIPPAFFASTGPKTGGLMIMTSGGKPYGPELLEMVADPLNVAGQLFKHGDLLVLDAPMTHMHRLSRQA